MAPATFTLRATYNKPNGEPQIQSRPVHIYVTGTKQVKDTAGNVIISGRVEADVVDGVLTVPGLPDPRDPGYNPDNFGLTVSAVFRDNHPPAVSFGAEALDAHLTNGVLELEDVTPVDPSTFTPNATYADASTVTALDSRVTTVESDVAGKADSADLATVATTGNYGDLAGQPAIPATPADLDAEPAGLAQTTQDTLAATYVAPGQTVDNLTTPFYIAHRGGVLTAPEHTMEAYRIMAAQGFPIEQDVRSLQDNTVVVMHDDTTGRTTSTASYVAEHTAASWLQLAVKGSTIPGGAGAWTGNYKAPLMAQVLGEFGNRAILTPQATSLTNLRALIDLLERQGIQKSTVIIQVGGTQQMAEECVARGWPCAYSTTDFATAASIGVDWITGNYTTWTNQMTTDAHAAGLKVMLFTANRRHIIDGLPGVDAWFSDDPAYLSGFSNAKGDPFTAQTWASGMLGYDDSVRGQFYAPDWWGMDLNGAAINNVLHGYLTPTDPSSYTLDFNAQIDAVNGGDMTRGIFVYLGKNDKKWNDQSPLTGNDGPDGYSILLRADGTANLYILDYTADTKVNAGSQSIGSALTLGTNPVSFRVVVDGTGITISRTDAGAGTPYTRAQTGFRPLPAIHFGRFGSGFRINNISVT